LDEAYAASHPDVTPGQYVMLCVTDTGIGMDAGVQEHIFEPFFTTKEAGKGTGLGLSTVYGIVNQSGGTIWVYSEPGKGTVFKIYLPRDLTEAGTAEPARKKSQPAAGTETILVVEDEPGVRNLMKRVLESSGYTVRTAANGGEALLTCERIGDSIHLMITDIVMPEMSGRVLSERLAKICPAMKILYMSGYTEDAIIHHGVLAHGINFISKPFSLTDLTAKVREVLDM
jgi:CheY-like chemotaxis protein